MSETRMALRCVGEEYLSARMDLRVVQGVELPSEEVVQEHSRSIRRPGVDRYDRWCPRTAPRSDQDQRAVVRARTTVGHLDILREAEL